ncbi:Phosphodiesterase I protein [Dioscorea alata]|uniref:Phosphodiesterase I protein n=1 Tax=Dioscorea alata TaxID=55571 RepID=A0ACB7WP76_DIOAL|nr:Phosphodiesterase I protein [Dioscorea alata]
MLSGRESLIRLIGKRRRTLPPNLWLLLVIIPLAWSLLLRIRAVARIKRHWRPALQLHILRNLGTFHMMWNGFPALFADSCLATGKKRKLTQSTLLQFNFCPKLSNTTPLTNSSYPANYEKANESNCANESSNNHVLVECASVQICGGNKFSSNSLGHIPRLGSNEAEDSDFVETLETFIVGRRFHQNIELRHNASLSVVRDLENSNDIHAIKGSITSLPKHPLGAVPIRLVCQMKLLSYYGRRDVVWVVDHAKAPSYQRNFRLLVQDVLHKHLHLFVNEETSFLGSFNLLSDDAQRLFVRLYTRKGPWFRMANISYPEISDPKKAILELQLAGYIDSFPLSEAPSINDIRDVFDVLSAFEIREISKLELCKFQGRSIINININNRLHY